MRTLFTCTIFCSLAVLAGCLIGSRYVGDWQRVGGPGQSLIVAHVRGVEFTVTFSGLGGKAHEMPGFLLSNGVMEVGGTNDVFFQYLVSDKDSGHLYLLPAMDMRAISSQVQGGRVSKALVNGLNYVEFTRTK